MVAIYVLVDLYLFFIVYVASINMIRAHHEEKLNGILWVLCVPFVAFGLLLDFVHQITLATLLFWELPRELTVTSRLKRHITAPGYRGNLARFLCGKVLSPFDHTGNHCD